MKHSLPQKVKHLQEIIDQLIGLLEPIADQLEPAEYERWEQIISEAPELLHEAEQAERDEI